MRKKNYEDLTIEKLKNKFPSLFDLANLGIDIAQKEIKKGHEILLGDVLEQLKNLPQIDENVDE